MRNTCPKCGTAYAAAVGRKFTCKCGTPVVVAPDGLTYQDAPAPTAPSVPAPVQAPEPTGVAFNFDEPSEPEPRPAKPAKAGKRPPRAEEDEEDLEPAPTRPTRKPSAGSGELGEYLAFRKFIVPVLIKLIFWFFVLVIALVGLGGAIFLAVSGG